MIGKNKLYGLLDEEGRIVVPPSYVFMGEYAAGRVAVRLESKLGYLDEDGNVAISPVYEWTRPFSEGLAAVSTEVGWGYIDPTGEFVIAPQFSTYALPFRGKLAVVMTLGKEYLIDRTGSPVWENTQ